MPKMPDERMPFCSPDQYEKCADPALDELVQKDNSVCVCTTPCSVRRYSKEVSLLKLPSDSSVDYLSVKFKKTPEYIKDRIILNATYSKIKGVDHLSSSIFRLPLDKLISLN